jgi:hypothetical protein
MSKLRQPTLADAALLIMLLLVVAALAQAVTAYLSVAGAVLRFPYPLEYGEGPVLDQTMRLARGQPMYPAGFGQPPFNVANTPPLYQLILSPFASANGPAYWYGRALSMACALASAILVALIIHRLTADWLAGAVAGLLLLTFPHIAMWSLLNRVDTLGLALSLAGLYVVVRFPSRALGIGLAAALFVAAIFTRPTYAIAGPATACVWLWAVQKLRKQALTLGATVVAAAVALFLALNVATSGAFGLNVFIANANEFAIYRVAEAHINLFVHAAFITIAGLLFLALERTTEHTRSWEFVLLYLVFATLASLFVGLAGSSVSSLCELVAATCILFGATLAWLGRNAWLRTAALAVVALQLADLNEWTQEEYLAIVRSRMEQRGEIAQLADLVRNVDGDTLTDEFMGLMPLSEKRIFLQPVEFLQLGERGLWSDAYLIDQINRRAFPMIALYEPLGQPAFIVRRWPKSVRDAIYANYEMTGRLAETLIYTPR